MVSRLIRTALIDADILRYEVGYAATSGYQRQTESEGQPGFDWVDSLLTARIANILVTTGCDEYVLYITRGRTFRYDIAVTKPYKGTRTNSKPYHYKNLTAVMEHNHPCVVVTDLEADDQLAIDHLKDVDNTIICSRDKDLRTIPGHIYSWEMGNQASFGPKEMTQLGELSLVRGDIVGGGYAFFCAQLIMGDTADNIQGVKGRGKVCVAGVLIPILEGDEDDKEAALFRAVELEYQKCYGEDWDTMLTEMATLLWIVRRCNKDGTPQLWENGLTG